MALRRNFATGTGEAPILAELMPLGFVYDSLADLRHSGTRYRDAVPVLLSWLPKVSDLVVKEEIVRALSLPWAKPVAAQPMIAEFRKLSEAADPTGTGLKWAIGNALAVVADDSAFDELADLVRDRCYGPARQMIVLGLGKSRRPEAVDLLLGLLDAPDVEGHVVKALGKLKAPVARSALENKLDADRAWVRFEARKALSKLPGTP